MGLVKIAMPECYLDERLEEKVLDTGMVISKDNPGLVREIQKFHDEFNPDVIVAVNSYPAYICSKLKVSAPVWADLNGWIMAEGQAQAFKSGSNDYLAHYFEIEKNVLRMGDKFSSVSQRQKFAVLGELAFLGRLNGHTFGYEFCEVVGNATEEFENEEVVEDIGLDLPEEAFVVLWIGGYNTWVDEITLFKGLEEVMKKHADVYFVSTGGEIKGLDNKTFANFRAMIEESEFRDRFKFMGWIDSALMPSLYRRGAVGLNVDKNCVETSTGARNRINEMMKFGLPVITTSGSEIAEEIGVCGAGIVVKSGDYLALAEAIGEVRTEWGEGSFSEKYKSLGENGRKYTEENSYVRTLDSLLKWLKDAKFAPDRGVMVDLGSGLSVKALWRYLRENGFKKSFKKFLQKMGA